MTPLPQYAAEAVAYFEQILKNQKGTVHPVLAHLADRTCKNLRKAMHVVLPDCGEIYRPVYDAKDKPIPPNQDEAESFANMPSFVTCYAYYEPVLKHKILVLVMDPRQAPAEYAHGLYTLTEDGQKISTVPTPDSIPVATMTSCIQREGQSEWLIDQHQYGFTIPLSNVVGATDEWKLMASITQRATGRALPFEQWPETSPESFYPYFTAVVQALHAMRAGATLERRIETNPAKRWKLDKKGVGSFEYHVLQIPAHARHESASGTTGGHASPRFHMRRAHIRKLASGKLTFVKQCFVGDRELGVVEKSYEVHRGLH